MKYKAFALTAILAAALFTGCGGKESGSSASGSGTAAANTASASAAESGTAASTGSNSGNPAVTVDGSRCGVLQKAADQDAFTVKGLILTTGSGHHDYPAIGDLIGKGYQTEGLYSEYYLSEWIDVYADCDPSVNFYVVKNQPDADYAAMTEADLIRISEESDYPVVSAGLTPDADENGKLTSFYVHPEMGEGLYNMCFISGGKVCYLVQLRLTPEPAE